MTQSQTSRRHHYFDLVREEQGSSWLERLLSFLRTEEARSESAENRIVYLEREIIVDMPAIPFMDRRGREAHEIFFEYFEALLDVCFTEGRRFYLCFSPRSYDNTVACLMGEGVLRGEILFSEAEVFLRRFRERVSPRGYIVGEVELSPAGNYIRIDLDTLAEFYNHALPTRVH